MYEQIICEICIEKPGKYKCRSCGKIICPEHIDNATWLCLECIEKYKEDQMLLKQDVSGIIFYGLLTVGLVLIFSLLSVALLWNVESLSIFLMGLFPFIDFPYYVYGIGISIVFFFVSIVLFGFFLRYVLRRVMK